MHRRHRDHPVPYTGTPTRMQSLPHKSISSIDYHKYELLNVCVICVLPYCFCFNRRESVQHPFILSERKYSESVPTSTARKCVYSYEDKYTFARILVADSLVFDSHFESGNLLCAYRLMTGEEKKRHVYDLYMHNDVNTKVKTALYSPPINSSNVAASW